MADKNETKWLNVKDWQVKPFTKKHKDGSEHDKFIITLGVEKTNDKAALMKSGSLDGYATIEVDKVIQKEGGRYSVPLDSKQIYAERYVKNIVPEAQTDRLGEPVINPNTGKQYDLKEYAYRQITGGAIVEREAQRIEKFKEAHPDNSKETGAASKDTPLDKSALDATSLDDLTFD